MDLDTILVPDSSRLMDIDAICLNYLHEKS